MGARLPSLTARASALALTLVATTSVADPAEQAPKPQARTPPERSQPAPPMRLGAASNFSQGWSAATFEGAIKLPVRRFRDSVRWADVEKVKGQYGFAKPTAAYPARLDQAGARLTLTLNWGNPLYDEGKTPHSPEALAAFGRFAAALVQHYPAIDTLEIGNEINGGNFVSGPVKQAGLAQRAGYHLAMVRAAAVAVKAVRPNVTVIGGATHSLPAGFLWPMLEMTDASHLEGLAVHPYTTPIDQLPAQIGVLRRNAGVRRLPLYITEFGSQDPQRAGDHLLRGYASLSALGVREMDWYPLNPRGDGLVPLISADGAPTRAGEAFRFIQAHLAGQAARTVSPDLFTSAYAFGPNIRVLWGAERGVDIDPARVSAFDATGQRLDPRRLELAEDRALVLIGTAPLDSAGMVRLGCSALIADSFRQFTFPPDQIAPGGFAPSVRSRGRILPFETMPGQQRPGLAWFPYLGRTEMPNLRLSADTMVPALGGPDGAIVLRYVADRDRTLRLSGEFSVSARSDDGISVVLSRSGTILAERIATAAARTDTADSPPTAITQSLSLRKGEALTFAISPRANARGDATHYRIRLFDEMACPRHAVTTR